MLRLSHVSVAVKKCRIMLGHFTLHMLLINIKHATLLKHIQMILFVFIYQTLKLPHISGWRSQRKLLTDAGFNFTTQAMKTSNG